ncbi:MAG: transketolase, partial [Deltaproteobacteria bacterium]|nr:transketolase [Deltaproteobacteria bacterium]
IAYGAPHKQDTSEAHGSPLGDEEIRLTKEGYGWPIDKTFFVPDDVREFYAKRADEGKKRMEDWKVPFVAYTREHPDLAREFQRVMERHLPEGWERELDALKVDEPQATRQSSGKIMQVVSKVFPELIGGSADLAVSNNTRLKDVPDFSPKYPEGRNLHFGIREHAMAAITNGLALHGGVLPFAATFLIFSDYMRPSLRLAAMMNIPTRYVFTHDSIGLGEDGPTHQPIEHLMSLRAIPNFTVIRPADGRETLGAWKVAASERNGPVALSLTRQKVSPVPGTSADGVAKGAYIIGDVPGKACVLILIATGSELGVAFAAWKQLADEGVGVRLVSMPSWELFARQPKTYQDGVLPPTVKKRLSVEAGITFGWERFVGSEGASIGIDRFGASAPAEVSFQQFGFTPENILARAKALLNR